MIVGIPKETKDNESRVALTPDGAARLSAQGHQVRVQANAGRAAGFSDRDYRQAGAMLVSCEQAWDSELVVKVKEPLVDEYRFLEGQMLFTYLHLAGAPLALTRHLLASGTSALAYETLEDEQGRLPLLAPMSAIAGNMAVSVGNHYLAKDRGGKGTLLGRVLGHRQGKVLVIGDGVVGRHAAASACGLGAQVLMAGCAADGGAELRRQIGDELVYFDSTEQRIATEVRDTDLLVGAVLRHGARAPFVVSEAMVRSMQPGSVIVDVSIDQGGCVATSQATSHSDPVYLRHGVIHYCVSNMPGAYPRTSTLILTHTTLPYIERLCNRGSDALTDDPVFASAINCLGGKIRCRPVAEALDLLDHYQGPD